MDMLKAANLGLAFLIEILMLGAFFYWGLQLPLPAPWTWLAAILAVGVAVAIWAIWGAPRSARRLRMPALLVFKLVMFGAGALALWAAGQPLPAAGFAIVAALHLVLAARWRQV